MGLVSFAGLRLLGVGVVGALTHGGRAVIVPWEVVRSPAELWNLVRREQVTILNQTPSAFYEFADAEREDHSPGPDSVLRMVVFGGEALDPGRLRGWFPGERPNSPILVNMYGITETTVHVSYLELTARAGTGVEVRSGFLSVTRGSSCWGRHWCRCDRCCGRVVCRRVRGGPRICE